MLLFVPIGAPEKPAVRRGWATCKGSGNLFATARGSRDHIIGISCLINLMVDSVSELEQIKLNLPKSSLFAVGSRLKQC